MNYPSDIDKELIPLLDTLNSLNGVSTLFSCSGHEKNYSECGILYSDFYVCLKSNSIRSIDIILNAIYHFNDNLENHGYLLYLSFGIAGHRYYDKTMIESLEVSIRARKCNLPVKFEHLDELRRLIEEEKDKYDKQDGQKK